MRFSPKCTCCGGGSECPRCATHQNEYDVTLWVGDADEQTFTVTYRGYTPDPNNADLETGYGCCNWSYEGVLSDFNGIADEGNGRCDGSELTILSLGLQRDIKDVNLWACYPLGTPAADHSWVWTLYLRIHCIEGPGSSFHMGNIAWPFHELMTGSDVLLGINETQNCDYTSPFGFSFTAPGVNQLNCDDCRSGAVPAVTGCLDCDNTCLNDPGNCRWPTGGADVVNAS